MSSEDSVAGINVRQLRDDKQRLEAENDKLYKAVSFSRNLNRDKGVELADAIYRIQQLEEALEHARWVIISYTAAQEKYLAPINAVLSREPSEAPVELEE